MLQFNFHPFPIITTERLLLRQITGGDANEILFLRSSEKVMQYLDRDPLKTKEEAVQLIEKITSNLNSNDGITWGIALQTDPALIGTIGFWKTDKENHRAEIGYMLSPAHQRKGIVQEAMTAALEYAFNTMLLHSIEANVNKDNVASIKLLEKNNFVREAYFRENYYYNGQFLDSVIYSLLAPRQ
jgi:[ribosomal protein S5]-alanine N-acetyltransferase